MSNADAACTLAADIAVLGSFLRRYRSADLITNLAFFETIQIERFRQGEAPEEGQILVAEYAAQLSWRHLCDDPAAQGPPQEAIEEARACIESILTRQAAVYMGLSLSDSLETRLRGKLQLSGLLVRNPGAPGLWISILRRLMDPIGKTVRAQLGFAASDVLELADFLSASIGSRCDFISGSSLAAGGSARALPASQRGVSLQRGGGCSRHRTQPFHRQADLRGVRAETRSE
jgi:hypothetical protein